VTFCFFLSPWGRGDEQKGRERGVAKKHYPLEFPCFEKNMTCLLIPSLIHMVMLKIKM